MTISPANIHFNSQGIPVADDFDDVYFSNENGIEETKYVFLQNNHIAQRWASWPARDFVIAETGFGTGLNFLVTLKMWQQFRCSSSASQPKHLRFISIEKYPLTRPNLQTALSKWPELAEFAEHLIQHYPPALAGCHRLHFPQYNATLDLWIGDVNEICTKMYAGQDGRVDAWYLDGFAPSKNPDMWQQRLYTNMARLAKQGCTFATFTAAGAVRRGLQEAGFRVEKRKGFGRKREMLSGEIHTLPLHTGQAPYFLRHRAVHRQKVVVIGGGIAASMITHRLAARGVQVAVYTQHDVFADGASGNRQGGFYPQLNAQASHNSRIQAQCFTYARRFYDALISQGQTFHHDFCGVLQLGFSVPVIQRYEKLIQQNTWPTQLVSYCPSEQVEALSGIPLPYSGLWVPDGGWIHLPSLVQATFDAASELANVAFQHNAKLIEIQKENGQWRLEFLHQAPILADTVVIATGSESADIPMLNALPFRLVRGQVEMLPEQAPLTDLKCVLCHKGYLTPSWDGASALGSTYIKNDRDTDVRAQETQQNLATQIKALTNVSWPQALHSDGKARAAIRCGLPDHLPVVGAVPDVTQQSLDYRDLYKALPMERYPIAQDKQGVFVLAGLGSRGVTTAPLLAEVLASQICGEPQPLSYDLLNALNPNRFLIRNAIRTQPNASQQ